MKSLFDAVTATIDKYVKKHPETTDVAILRVVTCYAFAIAKDMSDADARDELEALLPAREVDK